ncbi:hypothetical protein [Dyadobacter sp. BHUBP1]|uniref:hypothetical protein n=1 Tax=Dyadobacter sp. BHUBP1 TaxID=3424178 RepID=UPI003D3249C9
MSKQCHATSFISKEEGGRIAATTLATTEQVALACRNIPSVFKLLNNVLSDHPSQPPSPVGKEPYTALHVVKAIHG